MPRVFLGQQQCRAPGHYPKGRQWAHRGHDYTDSELNKMMEAALHARTT